MFIVGERGIAQYQIDKTTDRVCRRACAQEEADHVAQHNLELF